MMIILELQLSQVLEIQGMDMEQLVYQMASPFGISVGATTNNVFVGYGPFKDSTQIW